MSRLLRQAQCGQKCYRMARLGNSKTIETIGQRVKILDVSIRARQSKYSSHRLGDPFANLSKSFGK
jgi:hypothetical protein